MEVCTIVAPNYLPAARVLARSFKTHHPQGNFAVLLLDDGQYPVDEASEAFEVLYPSDLRLSSREFHRMALMYDVMELATAVKPFLLQLLLHRGASEVIYFDPDIVIFGSLHAIIDAARVHSIALTPHVTDPMPRDGRRIAETEILQAGVYNLGFLAVGPGSSEFLTWWGTRLQRDCIVDPGNMLFVDQRWIDFVPGLFPHIILRDPGFNVAYWNLANRHVDQTDNGYTVNGYPLVFFHFSGYRPEAPTRLSKHQPDPERVILQELPVVARLCQDYGHQLVQAGYHDALGSPYAYDAIAEGITIERRIRRLYRNELLHAEKHGTAEPPNPFSDPHSRDFLRWLTQVQLQIALRLLRRKYMRLLRKTGRLVRRLAKIQTS